MIARLFVALSSLRVAVFLRTALDRESPVGYGDVPSRHELNVDGPAILASGKDFQGNVIACVPRVEAYLGERRRKLGAG